MSACAAALSGAQNDACWASSAPQASTVHDLLHLLGAVTVEGSGAERLVTPLQRLKAGSTLYLEGTSCDAVYFVRAGTFKSTRMAEDGYEQVLSFVGRAELLGFDALGGAQHPTTATALEDSSVYAIAAHDLVDYGQRVPALARALYLAVSQALRASTQMADVMAAVAAEVRLARFLVQWSQRMADRGESATRFHLRMSRRDIASHLGLAHETVSRGFGLLASWGYLRVANRDVEILNLDEIRRFARSTRRTVEDVVSRRPRSDRSEARFYALPSA